MLKPHDLQSSVGPVELTAQLLHAIIDSSDDAIISRNLDGAITSWNKSAERLYGYTEAEAVGQPIAILIPSNRAGEESRIVACIKNGQRVDLFETVRLHKSGKPVEISMTVSPIRDPQGHIVGASKIARDATQMRDAERANRLLSSIVDSSDDAIISKDLNGIITSWNKSAERLFGYTEV